MPEDSRSSHTSRPSNVLGDDKSAGAVREDSLEMIDGEVIYKHVHDEVRDAANHCRKPIELQTKKSNCRQCTSVI